MIKKKFKKTVSKVKNVLRWSFSKKNFLAGLSSQTSEKSIFTEGVMSKCSIDDRNQNGSNTDKDAKETTKIKLFSKKNEKNVKKLGKFKKVSGGDGNKTSVFNSVTNNGETKPETNEASRNQNMSMENPFNMSKVKEINESGGSPGLVSDNSLISGMVKNSRPVGTGLMEYEEFHLKKSKVTLFELKDDVKNELSMIIPFQVDLPEDTSPTFDQVLKKGMALDFQDMYTLRN